MKTYLHQNYGLPLLPEETPGMAAAYFAPVTGGEEPAVRLYGRVPDFGDLSVSSTQLQGEEGCDIQILAMLWNYRKLDKTRLNIT